MSDPKRYTDLQVWEALHFGGSTNGWIRWEDYKRIVDRINEASLDAKNVNVVLIAENARLKAELERLRKAGDALYESEIGYYGEQILENMKHHSGELCRNWNAAKEGKQP